VIAVAEDKQALAEAFWRFSLMVYARPGVAPVLIALQDCAGHNVNLVLFGIWLAAGRGRRLDRSALARARAAIAKVDGDVVSPLRRLRRALKADSDPDIKELRRRVLTLELAAERYVQARLAATVGGRAGDGERAALINANLKLILGADFTSSETVALRQAIAGL
jgi:uncharacterized protein (TIGR02444 family)